MPSSDHRELVGRERAVPARDRERRCPPVRHTRRPVRRTTGYPAAGSTALGSAPRSRPGVRRCSSTGRTCRGPRAGRRAWPSPSRGSPRSCGDRPPRRRSRCRAGSRRARSWTARSRACARGGCPAARSSVGRSRGARGVELAAPGAQLAVQEAVARGRSRRVRRAAGSTACSSARISASSRLSDAQAVGGELRVLAGCGPARRPSTNSITKKAVPVTSAAAVSSTKSTARGTGTAVPRSAEITRCSRRMSCALESTWPSGGRRSTSGMRAPSMR